MKNKKAIIAVVLCLGAVLILLNGLLPGSKGRRAPVPAPGIVSQSDSFTWARNIIRTRRPARTEFILWGRNPFVSKKIPGPAATSLTLSGIIWDQKQPKAFINKAVVGVGDTVADYTVVTIKPKSVILTNGTENVVLTLAY
jgi:hypothetical protein